MATYKSDLVTNVTANPPVANEVALSGGRVRCCMGYFTHTATAGSDVLLLARIPSNARILSIKIKCATGSGAGNIGVFDKAGTALDADAFASAIVIDGWAECRFEATVTANNLVNKKLWELAAQSSDPGDMLDIGITETARMGANTSFQILYVVD